MPDPHSHSPTLKRALVIANPIAGSGRGEGIARKLERELTLAGVQTEVKLTSARGDARSFAAAADPSGRALAGVLNAAF